MLKVLCVNSPVWRWALCGMPWVFGQQGGRELARKPIGGTHHERGKRLRLCVLGCERAHGCRKRKGHARPRCRIQVLFGRMVRSGNNGTWSLPVRRHAMPRPYGGGRDCSLFECMRNFPVISA